MNRDRWKIIEAASVYSGIIIGAGFASGQEIIKFFVGLGVNGFAGLMVSGIVLAVSGWAVMDICVRLNIKSYGEFTEIVLGRYLGRVMEIAVILFIGILFCTMLAGAGAMGKQAFGVPFGVGVVIIAGACFMAFLFDLNGIVKINVVLAPFLVFGGILLGLYSLVTDSSSAFLSYVLPLRRLNENWIFSALIYASYNIITAVSVLSGMHEIVTSRKIAKYAGLLGGLCMTLLGVCFALPLYLNFSLAAKLEIPMLAIAHKYGAAIEYFYIILLIAAIFTTAVSNGFAVIEWLYSRFNLNKTLIKIMVASCSVVIAHAGFSAFVGGVYPFFGYIGLFEIAAIILFFIFGQKK